MTLLIPWHMVLHDARYPVAYGIAYLDDDDAA